jgi:hypothetical protein
MHNSYMLEQIFWNCIRLRPKFESSDNLLCALKQQLSTKREASLHKTENIIYATILEIGKKVPQEHLDSLSEATEDYAHNPKGEKLPFKVESDSDLTRPPASAS